jgi:molecular chaperone GrpE
MRGHVSGAAAARGYTPAVVHELVRRVEHAQQDAERVRAQLAVVSAERDALAGALAARPTPPEDVGVVALRADLANVRRQRDQEIDRARAEARGEGLARLADVADDLARAVDAHPDHGSAWARGTAALLARVRHQVHQAGGVTFGVAGDRFDPTVHEAVGTARGPADTVVAVHRAGLRLADGTLIRPAAVVVARGPHEEVRP